ncbi:MAG TPA: DUF86 domain-containing protein, partial [Sedimenticola sp.]|nr:DUF86 domain-containing protein [Sedimenticola sp.]
MAQEIVERKLESLRRCINRVREKCPPDPETLLRDVDLQDILVLNLTRAVQLCVDIGSHLLARSELPPPETMGQTFDRLVQLGVLSRDLAGRLKKAVGFRNVAVHDYQEIDFHIVHAIATEHLNDFAEFARAVSAYLHLDET